MIRAANTPQRGRLPAKKRSHAKHFPAADKPATSNDCTLKARMPKLEGGALGLGLPSMGPGAGIHNRCPPCQCFFAASTHQAGTIFQLQRRQMPGYRYSGRCSGRAGVHGIANTDPDDGSSLGFAPGKHRVTESRGGSLKPGVQGLRRLRGSILLRASGASPQAALCLPAIRREMTWARLRSPPSVSSLRLCVRACEAAISALIWPS